MPLPRQLLATEIGAGKRPPLEHPVGPCWSRRIVVAVRALALPQHRQPGLPRRRRDLPVDRLDLLLLLRLPILLPRLRDVPVDEPPRRALGDAARLQANPVDRLRPLLHLLRVPATLRSVVGLRRRRDVRRAVMLMPLCGVRPDDDHEDRRQEDAEQDAQHRRTAQPAHVHALLPTSA